jgi:spore germination protein KB
MENIINKIGVFIFCAAFYITSETKDINIIPILIIITVSAAYSYFDRTKLKIAAMIAFTAACIFKHEYVYFIPLILFVLIFVQLLAIPQLKFEYIKPVLGNGLIPVLKGGFSVFSFPFAETVVFIGTFASLKTKKSPYRVFFWGILISSVFILITTLRNISILGNMLGSFYFPSYEAVSMIRIGQFIERIEVTVSIVFVFSVFVKSSICLLTTCMGIGKMFNLKNYRSIVIQTGLLMIYFSYIIYDSTMQMKYWAFKVYPYYAFVFQVIIPVVIWISAEIKLRKSN